MLARTQTFMVENFPGKKKKERERQKTGSVQKRAPSLGACGIAVFEIFSSLHGIQSDSFNGLCF